MTRAIAKLKQGANRNSTQLDLTGIVTSLSNSFEPSANVWRMPQNSVTFGPLRLCIDASNLRSAIVKNAMVNNEDIRVMSMINIIKYFIHVYKIFNVLCSQPYLVPAVRNKGAPIKAISKLVTQTNINNGVCVYNSYCIADKPSRGPLEKVGVIAKPYV